jgi:hypothetical protein
MNRKKPTTIGAGAEGGRTSSASNRADPPSETHFRTEVQPCSSEPCVNPLDRAVHVLAYLCDSGEENGSFGCELHARICAVRRKRGTSEYSDVLLQLEEFLADTVGHRMSGKKCDGRAHR